jgi:hypothetical protein
VNPAGSVVLGDRLEPHALSLRLRRASRSVQGVQKESRARVGGTIVRPGLL